MSTPTSPFMDHAGPILAADPTLSNESRAALWNVFHESKDPAELARRLQTVPHPDNPEQTLAIPDDTKHKLWEAKQAGIPVPPPVDKVTEAVQRMVALPPDVLDKAEQHPNVLKAFTTAATTEPKAPAAPAGGEKGAGKGEQTPAAPKAPLAPRADGQPHFPSIPDGHKRILASNSGVYDIPAENIEAARASDPNLHILNP